MAGFTIAQVDLMNRTLEAEPDIPINTLKRAIGSNNWQAVKDFIGVFKSEAETEVQDSGEEFPMNRLYDYSMGEPEDINLKALDTLVGTSSQSVTEAREHLERCNYFMSMVVELRKRYEEGHLTVK